MTDDEDFELPKRRIMREHQLQSKGVTPWATKAALDVPFEYMAFDSAAKQTDAQRLFGASRGITKATPDTVLLLADRMPIWVELKWGTNGLDPDQQEMAKRLLALGHSFGLARSVVGMYHEWLAAGVTMRPGAFVAAQQYDGRVAAAIARLEAGPAKKPRASKSPPRFTAGKRFQARARKAGIAF
jgi:hypothetical protein